MRKLLLSLAVTVLLSGCTVTLLCDKVGKHCEIATPQPTPSIDPNNTSRGEVEYKGTIDGCRIYVFGPYGDALARCPTASTGTSGTRRTGRFSTRKIGTETR